MSNFKDSYKEFKDKSIEECIDLLKYTENSIASGNSLVLLLIEKLYEKIKNDK